MKTYLFPAVCLILAGCGRQEENHRELLAKLQVIESEVASKHAVSVRWAFASKQEIQSAIFQWSRDKMEQVKKSEALSPEVEAKVQQYETLQSELFHKQMGTMRLRPLRMPGVEVPAPDKDYEALSQKVAEAKAPVADIVERHSRQATKFREQYAIDRLIAEYVKDRYDLVVDSNEKVLYRSAGEVPDITEGVLTFFREKTKP